AALELDGAAEGGSGMTVAIEPLVLNGTGVAPGNAGALVNVTGDNAWDGNITLESNTAIGVSTGTDLSAALILDPTPAPTPPATLTKLGAGTLILPGINTYTGTTVLSAGTVQVDGSIGTVSLAGG